MWYEITTIPKGVKLGTKLNTPGISLGLVPAKSPKEAIERFDRIHPNILPDNVRVFKVKLESAEPIED